MTTNVRILTNQRKGALMRRDNEHVYYTLYTIHCILYIVYYTLYSLRVISSKHMPRCGPNVQVNDTRYTGHYKPVHTSD